jgi:hypothetical protein
MSRLLPVSLPPLLIALVASAALAIAAAPWALNQPLLAWIFKPLATLLVIAHAWPRGGDQLSARHWVRLGLIWSLVGDVALLWPDKGFLPGLVIFLLAHLAYLMAFTRGTRLALLWMPFGAFAAVAGVVLAALWPGVPEALRLPVLAYVLCLVRWRRRPQWSGAWAVNAGRCWRQAARCSCCRMRSWPPTSLPAPCRWPACGCWPATGRRSGALLRGCGRADAVANRFGAARNADAERQG